MILCADLHLRRTAPRARTDDYFATQERKFRFVLAQAQASPPLLVAGDFFHQPRPGEGLLRWVIDLLREYGVKPIVVPGQHDLPGHSLEQIPDSGLGVLAAAWVVHILEEFIQPVIILTGSEIVWGCAYGQNPHPSMHDSQRFNILLWHHMVINDPLWPGQEADKAPAILRQYPQFDLIVTGDNHTSFTTMNGSTKRWLVNPGSMMRMTAAQVNHLPHVFKWENGVVTPIPIPIEKDVLDLSELESSKGRDERIAAFVDRLSTQWETGLSFEKNLENFFRENKTDPDVLEAVWRCMG